VPSRSLKERALKASMVELGGFAGAQAMRLISTLVLSRLLFPEAFGLAALVAVFTQGLMLLTDVGIQQSIVQNDRGDDPRFLNTAWTIQVLRGAVLWVMSCALAWPLAAFYDQEQLKLLLPVAAFSILILGFSATSLHTFRRKLAAALLLRVELGSQAASLVVIVAWAYVSPTVWAIVAGTLVSAVYRVVASHLLQSGPANRFEWDRSAADSILHFGKWIFGSSALTFVSRQGDRILLGHYLGMSVLGIYSMAVFISDALGAAVTRITHTVLFPVLSEVNRQTPQRLSEIYYQARFRLDVLALLPVGIVTGISQTIIDAMYDVRYQEAGWMLQALCIRVAMGITLVPMETCLFSAGHTRFGLYQNIGRSLWIVVGVPLAWQWWGLKGVVWITATSEIPVWLILWRAFHRLGYLRLSREALALALFAAGMALGFLLDRLIWAMASAMGWTF
jgi:O-antigen/teichoic acid export membrane protein